jgi:hypothetical protein
MWFEKEGARKRRDAVALGSLVKRVLKDVPWS